MLGKYRTILLVSGLLCPGIAAALGLGELTLDSYLNEPLSAKVDLLEVGDLDTSQVKVSLGSRADFERAGVERAFFLTSLKFDVVIDGSGNGKLNISSRDAVREPFLDFLLEVRWPEGRVLREYTVLLDLPVLSGPASGMKGAKHAASGAAGAAGKVEEDSSGGKSTAAADTERNFAAGVSEQPVSGEEYLVKPDENLWRIASRARPAGATVQQTMLEIQRLNPEAFIGNNINQLKAGYVLRLPLREEISSTDVEDAAAEVAAQESKWLENRDAIARQRSGSDADGRDGTGSGEESGRLQIAGSDESSSASDEAGGISARLENLDRASRDNADMQVQVNAMAEQLDTLQRLLTLKDNQIAALQSAIANQEDSGEVVDLGTLEGTIEQAPEPDAEVLPGDAVDDAEAVAAE